MSIKRLHYLSGLTITLFIGLHLFNHFMSVFGVPVHIAVMTRLRLLYRNIFVEVLILLAVLTQIVTGLRLLIRKRKTATTFFSKLQIFTGLYLAVFFIIHVSAVFTGRFYLHLDTNFYFGVAGINTFPFCLFFIPYYALAIISVFGHLAAAHHYKMKRSVFGVKPKEQSAIIFTTGVIFTLIIFYGLTNHFKGVTFPKEYNVLIGK